MFSQVVIARLCVLTLVLQKTSTDQPIVIQYLLNVSAPINGPPVSLMCLVKANYLIWNINKIWYSHRTSNNFTQNGIMVSQPMYSNCDGMLCIQGNISVDVTAKHLMNNNTVIQCHAHNSNSSESGVFSQATILIADVPLAPHPEFLVVNVSTVGVQWNEPFTWGEFPITNYTVTVETFNQTNDEWEEKLTCTLSPDRLSITYVQASSSCIKVKFTVAASSAVGTGLSGLTQGNFPAPSDVFVETVNSEVTFSVQGTPCLSITFKFPHLCPFSDATYSLLVTDKTGREIIADGPYLMPWTGSGLQVTMEFRKGLTTNSSYKGTVTIISLDGQSLQDCFSFDTFRNTTVNTTSFTGNLLAIDDIYCTCYNLTETFPNTMVLKNTTNFTGNKAYFYSLIIGVTAGAVVMGIVCMSIFYIIITKKKCCQRAKIKFWMQSSGPVAVATNPLYAENVIYEEILSPKLTPTTQDDGERGYVTISPKNAISSPAQLGESQNTVENPADDHEAYVVMSSAGTLTGP